MNSEHIRSDRWCREMHPITVIVIECLNELALLKSMRRRLENRLLTGLVLNQSLISAKRQRRRFKLAETAVE